MGILGGIFLITAILLLVSLFAEQVCLSQSESTLRKKQRRLAPVGLALLLGILLAACSSSPSIRFLNVSPSEGTIFVVSPAAHAASLKTPANKSRGASVTAQQQDLASTTCNSFQFSANATNGDWKVQDVSATAKWNSSNTSVATVDNTGQVSAVAPGLTYLEATLSGASSGIIPVYVNQLNSLVVNPATPILFIGSASSPSTMQFSAIGTVAQTLGPGQNPIIVNQDISSLVTWSSTNPGVATISPDGIATSVTQGQTTIAANGCGINNSTLLTVGPPGPVSLEIAPASFTLAVGSSVAFSALELYSDGTPHPLAGTVQWSSSSKSSIISSSSGVAFGVSPGVSTIDAVESGANQVTGTASLAVKPAQARFAYVANLQGNENAGSISSFTVSAAAGIVTPLASTPAQTPQQVLLSPSGSFLYSIDSASFVHVYSGPSTGTLTLLDNAVPSPYPPVIAGGGGKNISVIDPTGQFLYVIDRVANTLYGFQIQQFSRGATPLGSLQAIPNGAPFNGSGFAFNEPTWIMTDSAGQFLYVINAGNDTIAGYVINPYDGSLAPVLAFTPLPQTGNGPLYGTTDKNGYMYVANSTDNSVTAYLINADGTWFPSGTLSVTGATTVINVVVDPTGQFLYVLDQGGASGGQVFAYNLVPALSSNVFGTQIGQPQAVGSSPTGMAVDPAGVLLAVDNKGSNSISLFTITTGSNVATPGALTPLIPGTVPTDASPQFVVFCNGLPTQ